MILNALDGRLPGEMRAGARNRGRTRLTAPTAHESAPPSDAGPA